MLQIDFKTVGVFEKMPIVMVNNVFTFYLIDWEKFYVLNSGFHFI